MAHVGPPGKKVSENVDDHKSVLLVRILLIVLEGTAGQGKACRVLPIYILNKLRIKPMLDNHVKLYYFSGHQEAQLLIELSPFQVVQFELQAPFFTIHMDNIYLLLAAAEETALLFIAALDSDLLNDQQKPLTAF